MVDDAYNIPNKQEWINRIQGSKYFLNFDLKAGFWQVKMKKNPYHGRHSHALKDISNGL
jgi:hypothetical protein